MSAKTTRPETKTAESPQSHLRRFEVKLGVIMLFALVATLIASSLVQQKQAEYSALLEARAMSAQLQASWDYIDSIQDDINYNADGTYDFKGVYCAISAKTTGKFFTDSVDGYAIRYVRDNPRNPLDRPDDFEAEALAAFATGGTTEYYRVTSYDSTLVFRYVTVLRADEGCLSCHGSPAGSVDETGQYREGMKLGDIAGARSIIIPMSSFNAVSMVNALAEAGIFVLVLIAVILAVRKLFSYWIIRPLEQSNEALVKRNEAKDNFLASMSHELRTPLSAIITLSETQQLPANAENTELQMHAAKDIQRNGEALLGMVNNVLDTARVESGVYGISPEELDIVDVFGEVRASTEVLADEAGIALEYTIDSDTPLVVSDWEALRKIFVNLVANALKFTPEGGSVFVHASAGRNASGEVNSLLVSVKDTGCGIPPEDCKKIFERFKQSPSSVQAAGSAARKGSGLGLFVSYQLAQLLGGSLRVDSMVGEGSTFTLEIPCTPKQQAE